MKILSLLVDRHKMRKFGTLVALLVLSGWGSVALAKTAPSFWISNMASPSERFDTRTNSQLYVVSFFFVGCPPCIEEMPALYQMMTTEFPEVPLLFVDPLPEDSTARIRAFVERLNIPLDNVYRDPLSRVGKKFMGTEMRFPTIVGVYRNHVVFSFGGLDDSNMEVIRQKLSALAKS